MLSFLAQAVVGVVGVPLAFVGAAVAEAPGFAWVERVIFNGVEAAGAGAKNLGEAADDAVRAVIDEVTR